MITLLNMDCRLIQGDCLAVLKTMPDCSVNTCVTSPPYFGLRDYGSDGQIGLEPTPDEFVQALLNVFREVRRVLRDDGTLWLNLGDSYAADRGYQVNQTKGGPKHGPAQAVNGRGQKAADYNLKPKDLIGIPWRVAFALQANDWYLRQDIIWHKPNPMPESVTDRCTKSHEYIFLLSKSPQYYYDHEAVKEPVSQSTVARLSQQGLASQTGSARVPGKTNGNMKAVGGGESRNKRSVWTVTTKPFKGAHFATFPPDLIEPCVLAGCPVGGTVLDPFNGAGTSGVVSIQHRRKYIGIDLNPEYIALSRERIEEAAVRFDNETKQVDMFQTA